ncbi:MAG: WD40 repeat domain-containing protein [bacterium]|nr:WD40 repeat domain-containing protein [bacterium]
MSIRLDKYTLLLLASLILFFPRGKFMTHEPFLVWKLEKKNPALQPIPALYRKKTGRLRKNHFSSGSTFTFFSNNTRVISSYSVPPGFFVTAGSGEAGAILYSNDRDKISFIDKVKGTTWDFKTYAYPFLLQNNGIIFLITGENGGYGMLDINGNELAKPVSSGMFITTFDIATATNLVLMGYADGYAKLFDQKLNELWFRKFTDSNIRIVKKVSLSVSGKYAAVLAGLEKEYLYLLDRSGDIILKHRTKEGRRRSIALIFSADERSLLEESDQGFRLYSTEHRNLIMEKKIFPRSAGRRIISMDLSADGRFIIMATRLSADISRIDLYDREGTLYYKLLFENENPLVLFSRDKDNFLIETKENIYLYGF